jgi:uncharacterized protein (UPF0332 family)
VKPEAADYLAAAERLLANARKLLDVGFREDAGRNCYLAGMNAARALLFEDGFTVTRRHKTLFGALAQVLHARGIHDPELTSFLPSMANLKAIADYETAGDGITRERAVEAVDKANLFVQRIAQMLDDNRCSRDDP